MWVYQSSEWTPGGGLNGPYMLYRSMMTFYRHVTFFKILEHSLHQSWLLMVNWWSDNQLFQTNTQFHHRQLTANVRGPSLIITMWGLLKTITVNKGEQGVKWYTKWNCWLTDHQLTERNQDCTWRNKYRICSGFQIGYTSSHNLFRQCPVLMGQMVKDLLLYSPPPPTLLVCLCTQQKP